MSDICPYCQEKYDRLAMHWNRSSCDYYPFTEEQIEILTGILMGDGEVHGLSDVNPHFRVRMTNRDFLEYLDREFGVLSKGVFKDRTASEQARNALKNQQQGIDGFETVNPDEYNALFGLRTCSHPMLHDFTKWYTDNQKRFPDSLTLTPVITKMWYVCDGWLAVESSTRSRAMFKVTNESDRPDYLISLFSEAGFNVGFSRNAIQVPAAETKRLLEWMGPAPPGFGYKWV